MQPDKHLVQAGAILGMDSLTLFNLDNPFMLTLRSAQFLLHTYIAYSVGCGTSEMVDDDENCHLMKQRFIIALHMILGSMVLATTVMLAITMNVDEINNCNTHETEHKSLCSEIDILSRIHFGMIAAAGAVGLIQGIKRNILDNNSNREATSPRVT